MDLSAYLYEIMYKATKFEACNIHTSENIEEYVIVALILKSSLSKLNALYTLQVTILKFVVPDCVSLASLTHQRNKSMCEPNLSI